MTKPNAVRASRETTIFYENLPSLKAVSPKKLAKAYALNGVKEIEVAFRIQTVSTLSFSAAESLIVEKNQVAPGLGEFFEDIANRYLDLSEAVSKIYTTEER